MNAELTAKIEKALDSIRPYLAGDGGDVRLHAISEEGMVQVELLGNCESCNMSNMTLKAGIEEAIRRVAPEVKGVVAVKP